MGELAVAEVTPAEWWSQTGRGRLEGRSIDYVEEILRRHAPCRGHMRAPRRDSAASQDEGRVGVGCRGQEEGHHDVQGDSVRRPARRKSSLGRSEACGF